MDQREAHEWSRHYDSVLWTGVSILTTAVGGLLAYSTTTFDTWIGILGLSLTVLTVYFAASSRALRRKAHMYISEADLGLVQAGRLRQWPAFILLMLGLVILWTRLFILKRPDGVVLWVAVAITGAASTVYWWWRADQPYADESHRPSTDPPPFVVGYMTLRKIVGVLGMLMPLVLLFGGMAVFDLEMRPSLSAYYHTEMQDVFVGTLCAIAVFLFAYRGHDHRDVRAGQAAGVGAVGTALFRTTDPNSSKILDLVGGIHLAFAATFFLALAYFSLRLFTLTNQPENMTERKKTRNAIYRTCGYVMLACLVLILVYAFLPKDIVEILKPYNLVFFFESVAILVFGLSWFTKSEAILADE
jgi:hypothetical protein